MFIEIETITGVRTINTDYIVQFFQGGEHPEHSNPTIVKMSNEEKFYVKCNYEEFKKKISM
ncbi:hypothetical protein ABEY43_06730 [Priestia megaterium]